MTDELLKLIRATPVERWMADPVRTDNTITALYNAAVAEPEAARSDRLHMTCSHLIAIQHNTRKAPREADQVGAS